MIYKHTNFQQYSTATRKVNTILSYNTPRALPGSPHLKHHIVLTTQVTRKTETKLSALSVFFITIIYSFSTLLDFLIKKVKHAS